MTILGLRTVVVPVTDLAAGKAWYRRALETDPYFDQPFYVGFAVGGFELGLVPDGTPGAQGPTVYWGVADAAAALAGLVAAGAPVREALHDVGDGIKVAAVANPFGNTFGLIENPHFSLAAVR